MSVAIQEVAPPQWLGIEAEVRAFLDKRKGPVLLQALVGELWALVHFAMDQASCLQSVEACLFRNCSSYTEPEIIFGRESRTVRVEVTMLGASPGSRLFKVEVTVPPAPGRSR